MGSGPSQKEIINFGSLPAGAHLFHFYAEPEDLLPVIIAYFRPSIARQEMCIWITSGNPAEELVRAALPERLPGFSDWERMGKAFILNDLKGSSGPRESFAQQIAADTVRARELGCRGVRYVIHSGVLPLTGNVAEINHLIQPDHTQNLPVSILSTSPAGMCALPEFQQDAAPTIYQVQFSEGRWQARAKRPVREDEDNYALLQVAEKALIESQQRYFSLFEFASDAIFLMRGHIIIECNRRCEEIFGMSRDEILGCTPFDLSPELQPDGQRSAEIGSRLIQLSLEGTPQVFSWVHQQKNGSALDMEINLGRVMVNGEALTQAVLRDMTAWRRAEQIEHERSKQAEALRMAADELNSTLNPQEVMLRVLKNMDRIIPNDDTNLVLIEADQYNIVRLAQSEEEGDKLAFFPLTRLH
ncbi:MAG: PAS domain S-box protein, partial [Anaerolineaceae bacterium]|nr:PAS domain S-box protein [Anaerolineaceae bacterium]